MALAVRINNSRRNIEYVRNMLGELREKNPALAQKIMPYFFLVVSNQMRVEDFLKKYARIGNMSLLPILDNLGLDKSLGMVTEKTDILRECVECAITELQKNAGTEEIEKKCLGEISKIGFFSDLVNLIEQNKEIIAMILGSILILKFLGGDKHGTNYDN